MADKLIKPLTLKNIKFLVSEIVYLKTDPYQYKRIVIEVRLTPNGYLYVTQMGDEPPTVHYDIELSEVEDKELRIKNMDEEDDE